MELRSDKVDHLDLIENWPNEKSPARSEGKDTAGTGFKHCSPPDKRCRDGITEHNPVVALSDACEVSQRRKKVLGNPHGRTSVRCRLIP